jgi:hypothetical protein
VKSALPAALVILAAATATAQAPLVNAKVERRTLNQALAREVQAIADRNVPAWIGYRVPMARRTDAGPWDVGSRGRCRLEPPTELVMLARVEARAVTELRSVAVDCDIDAGGMPLVWLEGVDSDDSVAWLASFVNSAPSPLPRNIAGDGPARLANAALGAIAQHGEGVLRLIDIARSHPNVDMRRRAMTWLGRSRDPRAVDFFAQILLK